MENTFRRSFRTFNNESPLSDYDHCELQIPIRTSAMAFSDVTIKVNGRKVYGPKVAIRFRCYSSYFCMQEEGL